METYEARLASFAASKRPKKVGWPLKSTTHPHLTPARLAAAGFFHDPGPARNTDSHDSCRCFVCNLELGGWDEDDDPYVEHMKRPGECGWKEIICRIEVDRASGGPGRLRTTYPDADALPSSARSAEYREQTFGDWWPHESPSASEMARAGFISKPSKKDADSAQCPLCSYEVLDWEAGDDPLAIHRKKSPECPFFTAVVEKKATARKTASKPTRRTRAATANSETESVAPEPEPASKRKGRQTKASKASASARPTTVPEAEPQPESEATEEPAPAPKRRGRKATTASASTAPAAPEEEPEPEAPKRRGRAKASTASTAASTSAASASTRAKTTRARATRPKTTRKKKDDESDDDIEAIELPVGGGPIVLTAAGPVAAPMMSDLPGDSASEADPMPESDAEPAQPEPAPEPEPEPEPEPTPTRATKPLPRKRVTRGKASTTAEAASVPAPRRAAPTPRTRSAPTRKVAASASTSKPSATTAASSSSTAFAQLDKFANVPPPPSVPAQSITESVAVLVNTAVSGSASGTGTGNGNAANGAAPSAPSGSPAAPPLTDEQRNMTLEEYVRQQFRLRGDAMKAEGEAMIAAFEARTAAARLRVQNS